MDALRFDLCCANKFKSYQYVSAYRKAFDAGADCALKLWHPIMHWDKGCHVLNAHKWRYLSANLAQFWPSYVTWVHMDGLYAKAS